MYAVSAFYGITRRRHAVQTDPGRRCTGRPGPCCRCLQPSDRRPPADRPDGTVRGTPEWHRLPGASLQIVVESGRRRPTRSYDVRPGHKTANVPVLSDCQRPGHWLQMFQSYDVQRPGLTTVNVLAIHAKRLSHPTSLRRVHVHVHVHTRSYPQADSSSLSRRPYLR